PRHGAALCLLLARGLRQCVGGRAELRHPARAAQAQPAAVDHACDAPACDGLHVARFGNCGALPPRAIGDRAGERVCAGGSAGRAISGAWGSLVGVARRAGAPVPAMIAAGVARPSGQGQAITSTATAFRMPRCQSPVATPQATSVSKASTTTTGTNTSLTRST